MIEFECENCGEKTTENLLPGKHAVIGTTRLLDRQKACCGSPRYFDSRGFREEMVKPELRDMVSSLTA